MAINWNYSSQKALQFDGVFFQKFMETFCEMDVIERKAIMEPVGKYRIYAGGL